MIPTKACLDTISFPRDRSWMHVVATYDGETTALYINGQPYESRKWSGRKSVMPIALPLKIGGHGGLFRGAVDNFRLYRRALTAEEAKARYDQRIHFRPQIPPRKIPGTIDGTPYSGCGRSGSWASIPLRRGALRLSNTGEMEIWGASKLNPSNQFDFLFPISVLGQPGWNERYYREVSGRIQFRRDGTARLEVAGRTAGGLNVEQSVQVNASDEVHVRYRFAADDPRVPEPGLTFTQHVWAAALRFVGHDERGPITGNMMDLDGELSFRDLLEINLVSSDNRLVVKLGPGTRLHVKGSRDPAQWLNGYTTMPGDIRSLGGAEQWAKTRKVAVETMFQLESDDLPCRLDRRRAREVTANVPFDFSRLYDHDPSKLALTPLKRDSPIFMDDEPVAFQLDVPKEVQGKCRTYPWTLSDAHTGAEVLSGELAGAAPLGGTGAKVAFSAPKPGVYVLRVRGLDAERKPLGEASTEVVIAGEIPQSKGPASARPKLRKVDEVDFTKDDPGHDFFSFSGKSQVVRGPHGSYRRTLTYQECRAELERQGLPSFSANDWFGVRFRTTPGRVYVVEVEYPDLAFMSASAYLVEPKDNPADGQCRPVGRTTSGVFTGSFLPHDGRLKVMQMVQFASAPWMAACWQNAHFDRPSLSQVLDPACAKRMTLYEVEGDLPALDAPSTPDRQIGVYCESGGLALSTFGPEKFRGENGNWLDRPDRSTYYRHAYPTVANLIRYMRYRGDTTLFYGIYRYRAAMFPSRTFPPASSEWDVDLPALIARIIENAREKFLDFRSWAMAQTHLAFQKAFAEKAPGKDYLAIDFYYDVFHKRKEWPSPLDAVRRIGFGPVYCKGVPGFVYSAYMPEANGCTYWEHSNASWDIVRRIRSFITDDRLARALDSEGRTAHFLHRQFYEQSIFLPKDSKRKWIWAAGVDSLGCISYPQQAGRDYLADFAYMLARGTPNYVSYCWCDSTIPLGHEPLHREIAAVYRRLPAGRYREADRKDGVFARVLDGANPAFYVVNTTGGVAEVELRTGCFGTFTDPVGGQTVNITGGRQPFRLQPYECKLFLPKRRTT
jgi:hypothetical protein